MKKGMYLFSLVTTMFLVSLPEAILWFCSLVRPSIRWRQRKTGINLLGIKQRCLDKYTRLDGHCLSRDSSNSSGYSLEMGSTYDQKHCFPANRCISFNKRDYHSYARLKM